MGRVSILRGSNADLQIRNAALLGLVERIARMGRYEWPEDESWSDDQAEDALVTLNHLIDEARKLAPHIAPSAPVGSGDEGEG